MLYAWPLNTDDRSDLTKRIRADLHPNETAACPCCDQAVTSLLVNDIWQWIHRTRCKLRKRSKTMIRSLLKNPTDWREVRRDLEKLAGPSPDEHNQCDGCRAGRPVDENDNHNMNSEGGYTDLMACQRWQYERPAADLTADEARRLPPDTHLAIIGAHIRERIGCTLSRGVDDVMAEEPPATRFRQIPFDGECGHLSSEASRKQPDYSNRNNYPIVVEYLDDSACWMAHHPDFGRSACSATGDTPEEAVAALEDVCSAVVQHFASTGKQVPRPSALDIDVVELAECVHCDSVTIVPVDDHCACGNELHPVSKTVARGSRILNATLGDVVDKRRSTQASTDDVP